MRFNKMVMGVLNVTPDSFFDGGAYASVSRAVRRGREMIEEGVSIIDIGGESTGPGSVFVEETTELRRVIPVIKKLAPLARRQNVLLSIDTYKAAVARKAIEAGADMVNDVTALRGDAAMAGVIAQSGVPVVLMYAKDKTPRTTQKRARYRDVMQTVKKFFEARRRFARRAGIKKSRIILDPGMGAFISAIPKYSFEILRRLPELTRLDYPILIGASRKSFLGGDKKDRLAPSLAAAALAFQNGASILRVHDTKETIAIARFFQEIA